MSGQYVEQRDGGFYVLGTRVSLDSIVYRWLEGLSAEAIADCFPVLTLGQVYGAVAYYLSNRAKIDEHLRASDQDYEAFRERARSSNPRLAQKLDHLLHGVEVKEG